MARVGPVRMVVLGADDAAASGPQALREARLMVRPEGGRSSRLVDVEDWAELARCRGMDPEAFFGRNLHEARAAIRTCDLCEVRQQCLDYAVEHRIDIGVWGGLTERQRRSYVRQHRIAG